MGTDAITELKPSKSAPLLGFWYPACISSSIAHGAMQGIVLLGQPILVFRGRDGAVSAVRDICPHRGMPLSFGRFDGERVACAYHGWQFDTAGRCRHIPSLVNGSPIEEMTQRKRRFYFDQEGRLTGKLGVRHTPAVAVQDGRVMKLTEIKLKGNS